jgi:glucose/mannose transport system permease protein
MTIGIESRYHRVAVRPGRRPSLARIAIHAALIGAAAFYAIPLLVMISTALKSMPEIRQGPIFSLPIDPSFAAWSKAWLSACTGLYCEGIQVGFWNSVRITVPSVFLSVLLGAFNGYILAVWRIPRAEFLLSLMIFCAFIPYQVILFPIVKLLSTVGLYGSLAGIVVIHVVFSIPILTLLFRNFFVGVPPEIMKAARIDNIGFLAIFLHLMLPLARNVIIVAVILQFTGIWNDFLLGLVFGGRDNIPMTVQLNNIVNTTYGEREYNVNMAATMLTALPPLLLYLLSGRYFVRGLLAGALKG